MKLKFLTTLICILMCNISLSKEESIHYKISTNIRRLIEVVSDTQPIVINDVYYDLDILHLLEMTVMLESNYGLDNYKGRIAKSPFQYEEPTVNFGMKYNDDLLEYLEYRLGHKIDPMNDEHSPYVAYLIYMAKLRHHKKYIDIYVKKNPNEDFDPEWLVYKSMYNSHLGASKFDTWNRRKEELDRIYERWYNETLIHNQSKI